MKKIISWNVASIRARTSLFNTLIKNEKPDIILLQEVKAQDHQFPFVEFESMGYHGYLSGQKAYNGVAILSLTRMDVKRVALDGFEDQARFIETALDEKTSVISVYAPNGQPPMNFPEDTSRLDYKLRWFDALVKYLSEQVAKGRSVILGGDFNVIYQDGDVYNAKLFEGSALIVPEVRQKLKALTDIPMINILREKTNESGVYTFWDFQGGAWPRNHGILLDYFFVSNDLKSKVKSFDILKDYRGMEKTSDHAPICCVLDI